jgi:hypothetical protein
MRIKVKGPSAFISVSKNANLDDLKKSELQILKKAVKKIIDEIAEIDVDVASVYESIDKNIREDVLALREMVLDVAKSSKEIGQLDEALKWGDPSFLTNQTKSGSLVRVNVHHASAEQNKYAMYFHCGTTLIESFQEKYGDLFEYEGNRALIFEAGDKLPEKELRECIFDALTYKLK